MNSGAYHLQKHAGQYDIIGFEGERKIYVLKKISPTLPDEFRVDVYGWGPFKRLSLRR
ncbi:MAG: hypothetical protein ACTSUE_24440 [Promethearchaeota archaeon]